MATELVLVLDTVTGLWLAKQAGSSHIGDLAIVSGKIGANAVISAAIASGQIGAPHIAAGAIISSLVGGQALATPHILNQGILSASIGAAAIGTPHMANQAITSALVGAGALAAAHIANQGLLSSVYGAGSIAAAHIANQGLISSVYGAGTIGQAHLADYGIISGKIASGAITEGGLASGISIDITETQQEPSYRAAEAVAAYEGVLFTLSGYFGPARAAQSGRAPTMGVALAALASGALGTLHTVGRVTNTGWNFSGYIGQPLFLGTSSQLVTSAPSASGNYVQRIGQVIAPNTAFFIPIPFVVQIGQ